MKYIIVDKETLRLTVTGSKDRENFSIPCPITRDTLRDDDFVKLVYYEVLYPYTYAKERARGIARRYYSLKPPDSFIMAIAAIMWEGLIQGLTWDSIKVAVLGELDLLRSNKLAPQLTVQRTKKQKLAHEVQTRTELGFSWTEFSERGRPLYRLFLGVRRQFNKCSKEQRESMRGSKRRR